METIDLNKRSLPKLYNSLFLISILLILINSQTVFAQSNFTEGYIVTQVNDTTFGYIDYQEWIQTPDSIYFRTEIDFKTKRYGAGDLTSFYVAGEEYESAEVNIDLTAKEIRPQFMRTESKPKSKTERVFLQVLVKGGHVSLYMYHGNRENFYINKGDGYLELISHEFVVNRGGQYLLDSESKLKYMAQLQSVLPECAEVYGEKSPSYSSKFLIAYILDCNQFVGEKTEYSFQPKETVIKHGLVLGTGLTNFDIDLRSEGISYNSNKNLSVGYNVDFVLPRGRGRRTISVQLLYSYIEAEGSNFVDGYYAESVCNGSFCQLYIEDSYKDIEAKMGYIKLRTVYSYRYQTKDFTPVFLVGGSIGKLLNSENSAKKETRIYIEENNSRTLSNTFTNEGEIFKPADIAFNVYAGLGLGYKKYLLSILYEPNPKLLGERVIAYRGLSLYVKYTFGK